jgi:hypothetical protein
MQNTSNNILWYNNPIILFKNLDQFFPYNDLKYSEKINSIARLAVYLIIIINVMSLKKEWYIVALGLLILSYYYSIKNHHLIINDDLNNNVFQQNNIYKNTPNKVIIKNTINNQEEFIECSKPTINNPFMNYTLGEQYNSNKNKSKRYPACSYEDVKVDMRNKFRSTINTDLTDVWGQYISDRNFYTMPNTDIVNNQVEFAKWCYSSIDSGECKTYGSNCIKYRDPKYHVGRYSY